MAMKRYEGGFLGKRLRTGYSGSTRYFRLRGSNWSTTARPVIVLHGWSQADPPDTTLEGNLPTPGGTGLPVDALLATGRTIYYPFTGANFGHASTTSPSVGGTGTTAIDDMLTQATADGLTAPTVDLIGGSMGATNAINWSTRNPTLVHRLWLYLPGIEFSSLYDFGGALQAALLAIYGGANKAAFLAATAAYDPIRLNISTISTRIAVLASNPDVLIRYEGVTDWCNTWGLPLITTAANHFSLDDPAFDELSVVRWLA